MTVSKRTSLGISLGAIVLYWIYQIRPDAPLPAHFSTLVWRIGCTKIIVLTALFLLLRLEGRTEILVEVARGSERIDREELGSLEHLRGPVRDAVRRGRLGHEFIERRATAKTRSQMLGCSKHAPDDLQPK